MSVEAFSSLTIGPVEVWPAGTTGVEVSPPGTSVVEVIDETSQAVAEVQGAVLGLPGPPGLSFVVVAPGEDPPPDTPDRTFVFEGPL